MTNQMKKSARHQTGGTFLGILLGLIIGLGIAVFVAMTITKTSLPFTSKSGKQEKIPALTPGQIADPNKPLYTNKEATKEAAKDFAPPPPEVPAADAAKTGTADKVGTDKVGTDKAATDKAAADKAAGKITTDKTAADKAKPADKGTEVKATDGKATDGKTPDSKSAAATPPAKAEAVDEKWIYYLQAGAFREKADAENTKAKLALLGVEANINERASDNGALYRVRIGPFNQLEAMNRQRSKLADSGVDVATIRISK